MKKIIISALLMAGVSGGAYAASSSDIILGFRATGGQAATSNLEIDLGSISTFKAVSGTVTLTNLLSSGPNGSNGIDTIFGSNWASRSDLFWGATGTVATAPGPDGEVSHTSWGTSQANSSLLDGNESATQVWTDPTSTQANPENTAINSLYTNFATNGTVVGQSDQTINTQTGSWTKAGLLTTTVAFKVFSPTSSFENSTDITDSFVASDLFELVPNASGAAATFLGTLAIFANGNVTFTAIPEPSVYAAILGVATLGFVMLRRRNQQVLA